MRGNPACITWLPIRYRADYGTIGGAICQRRSTQIGWDRGIDVLTCGNAVEQYTLNACSTSKQMEDLLCQILDGVVNKTAHELPVARIMRSDMRLTKKASPRTW